MADTSIDSIQLSVRARNVLHRMGIHTLEELRDTPLTEIAQQRNMGAKTLDELKQIIENSGSVQECSSADHEEVMGQQVNITFPEAQMKELSRFSIEELNLSTRPFHRLWQEGFLTIDKVVLLSEDGFIQMGGLGPKSIDEIKNAISSWLQAHDYIVDPSQENEVDSSQMAIYQKITDGIAPIKLFYWRQLYSACKENNIDERIVSLQYGDAIKEVLLLPILQKHIEAYVTSITGDSAISFGDICVKMSVGKHALSFSPFILVDVCLSLGILLYCNDMLIMARDTFLDYLNSKCEADERTKDILQFRAEGESLKGIGDLYGLTRERVRQITAKALCKFPLLFEDYFREPFQCFRLQKSEFIRIFPEITKEGYEYLSIKYHRGKETLSSESLKEYTGLWKEQLETFMRNKKEDVRSTALSKTELVMTVLLRNTDKPLTIDEFVDEYYQYIEKNNIPSKSLDLICVQWITI